MGGINYGFGYFGAGFVGAAGKEEDFSITPLSSM
jgi:hypothetical protein